MLQHNWKAIFQALKNIDIDHGDTKQFFIIMRTLNDSAQMRAYKRLRNTKLEKTRPELITILSNNFLDNRPDNSVGAEYKRFIKTYKVSAENLVDISRLAMPEIDDLEPIRWVQRRDRDVHEIWHVLAGYDTTAFGEVCVSAFTYGQMKSGGQLLFVLTVCIKLIKLRLFYYIPALFEAYIIGKNAKWLFAEDYNALLFEPLDSARIRLNIQPAVKYNALKQTEFIKARSYIEKQRKIKNRNK